MSGDFRVGPWLVEPSLNSISRNGTTVHLEPKAMEVLICLAQHAGETLPKEILFHTVWPDTFVTDDVLKHSISELRRVFEDNAREPHIIQTIPKRGYRLVAPVGPVNGSDGSSSQAMQSPVRRTPGTRASRRNLRMVVGLAAATVVAAVVSLTPANFWRRFSGKGTAPEIRSIAVLPLQNLSSDPDQEYFSDGMTDALITDLAQISSLKVISGTSTMRYKKTDKSLPQIARELNVDGIVEGTVQRSGDRVRITAQLIHGASDKHLWADSYERDIRDVFALERDLTSEITRQIRASLKAPNQTLLAQPRPVDPKALEAYLQGNYHLNLHGRGSGDEEKRKAAEYFQHAIDADPNFADAYFGLANAHSGLLWPFSEDVEIYRNATEKGIELAPSSSSQAHQFLADKKFAEWDWRGAEEEYRRAMTLNPSSFSAHGALSDLLLGEGRIDESIKEAEISQSLDSSFNLLPDILFEARQYDRAIEFDKALLLKDPDNGYFHAGLHTYYAAKGMHKESIEELERALTLFGLREAAAQVHQAFAVSGFQGAVRALANVVEKAAATKQVFSPVNAAATHAMVGDKDRAFYWLNQAYAHRDIQLLADDDNLSQINVNPQFDPLRTDPRFKDLLRRMKLPP